MKFTLLSTSDGARWMLQVRGSVCLLPAAGAQRMLPATGLPLGVGDGIVIFRS